MNIAMPICFAALIIGLFARRMTLKLWLVLALFITIVVARFYFTFNYSPPSLNLQQ